MFSIQHVRSYWRSAIFDFKMDAIFIPLLFLSIFEIGQNLRKVMNPGKLPEVFLMRLQKRNEKYLQSVKPFSVCLFF